MTADEARCAGVGENHEWREGCETCLRRTTPPAGNRQVWVDPPEIIAFFCPIALPAEEAA